MNINFWQKLSPDLVVGMGINETIIWENVWEASNRNSPLHHAPFLSCYFHFDRERFTMGNGLNKPAFCYEISLPYRALVSESNSVDESLDEVEILFHIACRHDLIL
jgi:hypothetical protein